jgi:adenylate cyclase
MSGVEPEPQTGPGSTTTAPETEAIWRGILLGTDPRYRRKYALLKRLPGAPRCYFCSAPFAGLGSPVARLMGRRPWAKNPRYCATCFVLLENQRGGAEIECSLMFADVRGSTVLAESMRPGEFQRLMGRFYDTAARVLYAHDAVLDKFVGDEAVAIFIPALSGDLHTARAVMAGKALLRATGHGETGGPWLPIGIGVHTGVAFVGAVGEPPGTTVTALGDVVNVAARVASAAGPGELLVTEVAAGMARIDAGAAEHRALDLKGKTERVNVVVLGVESAQPALA